MSIIPRIFLALLFLVFVTVNGQLEEWCIADEQTPDNELQVGLDWACGEGGADCSKDSEGSVLLLPKHCDHSSYAFNNYFQKYKRKGGNCFFNNAAMVTQVDPSKYLN